MLDILPKKIKSTGQQEIKTTVLAGFQLLWEEYENREIQVHELDK